MKRRNVLSLLLLWSIHTSGRSAAVMHSDLDGRNSQMSVDLLTGQTSPLQVKAKTTVDVLVGKAADLQCGSESGEGLVKWWQTPFGSSGDRKFRDTDPIHINNGTLRISRATYSHRGIYSCHLVDSNGTTVTPYRVNVMDKNVEKQSLRMARESEESRVYELALGVAPSVLVTFVIAFTLGAFSRPCVIKCLHQTRASIGHKGLFRIPTNKKSSWLKNSDSPKSPTPIKSPTHVFWSKNQQDEVHLEEANQTEAAAEEAQSIEEGAEIQKRPKRRSRVIKVYNYDEEGKRYDHITEPEEVVEELEPGPRQRVMSLTRLNTIMSQVQTPDLSMCRKSENSSGPADNPPQP